MSKDQEQRKHLINELINYLQGTCVSLSEGCYTIGIDEDSLTMEELGEIDNCLFHCDNCCWWLDPSEEACDGVCHDCVEMEED